MITINTPTGRFSYRVAGVAIVDDHILLHKAVSSDYWILPGGRAEMMEQARDTLQREMQEETGLHVTPGRLIWIVENFFAEDGRDFHEIGMYFEMTTPTDTLAGQRMSFQGQEGAHTLEFRWHPLDELPDFQPHFLRNRLAALPSSTEHIVHQPSLF